MSSPADRAQRAVDDVGVFIGQWVDSRYNPREPRNPKGQWAKVSNTGGVKPLKTTSLSNGAELIETGSATRRANTIYQHGPINITISGGNRTQRHTVAQGLARGFKGVKPQMAARSVGTVGICPNKDLMILSKDRLSSTQAYGEYDPDTRHIAIAQGVMDGWYDEMFRMDVDTGWFPDDHAANLVESVVTHEVGHSLFMNLNANRRYTILQSVADKFKVQTASLVFLGTAESRPTKDDARAIALVAKNVSEYATTNQNEMIADMWRKHQDDGSYADVFASFMGKRP